MNNENNTLSLEERMDQLEELIHKMESDSITLDESFAMYKEGIAEVKAANDMLDEMEKALLVLNEDGELEEF